MKIAVLCSGGDSPGMNGCLRAVVRAAASDGHSVVGIRHGYQGLINESFYEGRDCTQVMTPRDVSHILELGGTILSSSRCDAFKTSAGLANAASILDRNGIEGLIPIGGGGTLRGALALSKIWNGRIIGCPATIDNDVSGIANTIGFATAVQTAVGCIDKLRDTAESHQRLFLVEVMGRDSGHLALATSLASSAEIVCVPEIQMTVSRIADRIREMRGLGKKSIIIVVAEGREHCGASDLKKQLSEIEHLYSTRAVILGHVQRGGSPSPADRILATRLGDFAVQSMSTTKSKAMMVGDDSGICRLVPLQETQEIHKPLPSELLTLIQRMSC